MTTGSQPVRLAAIDLDGTLLNSRGTLSAGNAAALRRLAESGVLVAAATARWREAALRPFEQAGVAAAAIACAGADVTLADGRVVERQPLPREFVPVIARLCEEQGWQANFCLPGKTYRLEREMPAWAGRAPSWLTPVGSLAGVDLTGMLSVLAHVEREDPALAALDGWTGVTLDRARSFDGSWLLTVTAATADKGSALVSLCRALGIDPSETVAFGDSDVDLPMFAAAGRSVAMGDASEAVRGAATIAVAAANEDGFAAGADWVLRGN